jgi:hypothetical protein
VSVLFATPAYMGNIGIGYFASMTRSRDILLKAGIESAVSFVEGDALIGRARNQLMERFINSEFTHLFYVDSDLEWDPSAPLRMIEADKSCVCGLYPYKQDCESYAVSFETDVNGSAQMVNGLLPIKQGPAGFMLLKRKMIQRMMDKFPSLKYEGGYNFFQTEVKDGIYWGEDTAFMERWRSISGSIWAMPNIDFKHAGNKKWIGNYWKFHRGES